MNDLETRGKVTNAIAARLIDRGDGFYAVADNQPPPPTP